LHSDPLILAFDTSAAHCAAALVSGERVIARRVEAMPKGQAERLLPMIEEMLAGAGLAWADLAALAVCTGPGNFTGTRIGVAAARGIALGLGVPAIGVTRMDLAPAGAALPEGPEPVTIARAAAARLAAVPAAAGAIARPAPFYDRPPDARPNAEPPPRLLD
jgi:tRNA threonylcarbamoyladenosine biosynthesis protein TsaB